MNEPKEFPVSVRKKMISLFIFGLLLMVAVEIGISRIVGYWGQFRLGWVNQVMGALMTLGGIALVGWSVFIQYSLGKGTPVPKVSTRKLITTGPYSFTRNPMTLGAFFLYTGIAVWMGSGAVILLNVVIFTALLKFIYTHETSELTERFGAAYLDYRKKTPFLIPRCWRSDLSE